MVWETRAGRGGCTAVGFVPAVRIAPPCLPSRPQLLPFHTGRRALTPTAQLARLPPRFQCSSDSDVPPRALRRLVPAPTRTSGPLEELWSSSLFKQASDDLLSVRALQFVSVRPTLVQHENTAVCRHSNDPLLMTRSPGTAPLHSPLSWRVVSAAFTAMSDSALPSAKLRLPRDAPTEIRSRCRSGNACPVFATGRVGQCSRSMCAGFRMAMVCAGRECAVRGDA